MVKKYVFMTSQLINMGGKMDTKENMAGFQPFFAKAVQCKEELGTAVKSFA